MKLEKEIVIGISSFSVFGTEVPTEYLEGHGDLFRHLATFVPVGETFDPEVNTISFCPGADGDPGPNGEPGGKGGDITFTIEGTEFLRVSYHEISVQGVVQDQSDPVAHAIAVYSGFREFLQVSKAMKNK